MRAWWFEEPGPAKDVLQFGELADPLPGPGEVRVKVAYSAINPTDCKRRNSTGSSVGRDIGRFARVIPHNDGSGVIESVGEGVNAARIGERVWLFGPQADSLEHSYGSCAEFCVLASRQAIRLPERTSLAEGACLGVPAVTAHVSLFPDGPIRGETVFVSGASGRVGKYAVQLAKLSGATVIGSVSSDDKAQDVRALGCDHVLNYKTDDLRKAIKKLTNDVGVDRIIEVDFGSNIDLHRDLIRINGTVSTYGSPGVHEPVFKFYPNKFMNTVYRMVTVFRMPKAALDLAFEEITGHLKAGRLRHHIGPTYAFEDVPQAQVDLETAPIYGVVQIAINTELEAGLKSTT
jgi:NADPH:quinone reductase